MSSCSEKSGSNSDSSTDDEELCLHKLFSVDVSIVDVIIDVNDVL